MRDEINRIYNIFKSIIGNKGSRISDKDFVDLMKKDKLHSKCTEDEELLKLSVLSSHREWEGLLPVEHIYLNDCLGVECRSLTEKGIEYFNISPYELELLREEVVYGNTKYPVLINDIKELIELNKKKPNEFCCRYLILNYLQLHNVEKVRYYIEELKSYKDNVLHDFEVPFYIAKLYDEVIRYDDDEFIDEELVTALDLFEQSHEINKRLNIFDPVSYTLYYIKTLEIYLEYLNLEGGYNSDNKYTKFYDQPKNRIKREFMDAKYNFLEGLDEDFAFKVDEKAICLIEKHDDLILNILPYYDFTTNYDISPFFRGTNALMWNYYLNKNFPGKLDYFLSDDPPSPIIMTSLDVKQEQLKEMLLKEFKTEQEIKAINERYIENNDNDEDEENDYDELEEDFQIPDFYDEDYTLKADDLITSMSSPDWKNVSFDSFILSDLIDTIKDKNQSVELKIATCKAISLIEYECADVLLVKALRDQKDAVKEAALEGLINLKKLIDKDCFEVLNNFSDKEITNSIILSKIQDAIKSNLINKGQ